MPDERFPNDELDNRLSDIDQRMAEIDKRTTEKPLGEKTTWGNEIPPQDRVIREPQPIVETRESRERERRTVEDARATYKSDTTDRAVVDHDHDHDRRAVWPWVLGLLILGLVALPFLANRTSQQANVPTPRHEAIGSKQVGPAVTFQGKTYVGAGQAQAIAASDMVAVGKTTGGSTIYRGKGGGGGMGTTTYYLRRADGTFQALAPYNP